MSQKSGLIEKYYNVLQGLWREIDFRCPNAMECPRDIQKYNYLLQEERVYIFLNGLDDQLDNIWSDILQLKPFPTIEHAYAHVRREDTCQTIMASGVDNTTSDAIMATKGSKFGQLPTLVAGKHNSVLKSKGPSDGGKCTRCGNVRHNRDTCFKLHGYPKQWHELQAKKKKDTTTLEEGTGKAVVVTVESQLSLCPMTSSSTSMKPGNWRQVFCSSNSQDASAWIIDSGATNHMTFDPMNFSQSTPPHRTCIANANRVAQPIVGVGTVALSPSVSLSHTFLVPTLSNKLMSMSQITEELNYVVLMYSTFFPSSGCSQQEDYWAWY